MSSERAQPSESSQRSSAGDIATAHPIEVLTTTRVIDAAQLMADLGVGSLVVVDPATMAVVGVVTDRDVTVRLVARHLDAEATEVRQICSAPSATIEAAGSVSRVIEVMRESRVRRLPVVDEHGKPVGVISVDDLVRSDAVGDHELRELARDLADAYRDGRRSPGRAAVRQIGGL